MSSLSLSDPCPEDASICRWTENVTGSQQLANLADWVVGKPSALVGLALLGLLVRWLLHRVIDRVVRHAATSTVSDRVTAAVPGRFGERLSVDPAVGTRRVQRSHTIGTLLKSIVSGVVVAVVITMMLAEVGANIGPIIASAGIVGVALGFGAQSLVKDFLSGIFMIFEDQYGVGDVIDVGTVSGTVEAVSLRVTRLRDVNGTVWYVRNGEILRVGNKSQNWARVVLDVTVGFGEDTYRVRRVLQEVADDLWDDEDFSGRVIEAPVVLGVESMDATGVSLRVTVKTAPAEQWAVGRALRERVNARFAIEGIELFTSPRISTEDDSDAATRTNGPAPA